MIEINEIESIVFQITLVLNVFAIFFFYNNVVQKLKLNKIHTTVSRQQYCVLTGENKNPIPGPAKRI